MPRKIKALSAGPATPELIALEEKAEALADESLKETRVAAADWAKTITSITGVLGVVALVKGPEKIDELVVAYKVLVGLFILAGLIFALRSILYAAYATEGNPETWWIVGSRLKEKIRDARELAVAQLRQSRYDALAAAGCLIIAVGFAWYGPQESPETKPAMVLVTFSDRGPVCGELAGDESGLAAAANGEQVSIEGGNVRTLNVVAKCPETTGSE